jgi:hypothetical protein
MAAARGPRASAAADHRGGGLRTMRERRTGAAPTRGEGNDSRAESADVRRTALQSGPRRLVGVSARQRGARGCASRGSPAGVRRSGQVDVEDVVRGVVGVHRRLRGRCSLENRIGGRGRGRHGVSPRSTGESPRRVTGDSPHEERRPPCPYRGGDEATVSPRRRWPSAAFGRSLRTPTGSDGQGRAERPRGGGTTLGVQSVTNATDSSAGRTRHPLRATRTASSGSTGATRTT